MSSGNATPDSPSPAARSEGAEEERMDSESRKEIPRILKESFSVSRLVTLAATLLVTAFAGTTWFDAPILLWGLLALVGIPWLMVASLGKVPDGPGSWHARLFAGLGFPLLLVAIGTAAAVASDPGEAVRLSTATWLVALPLLLGAWRAWRGFHVPARLATVMVMVLLLAINIVQGFAGSTVPFFSLETSPVVLAGAAGAVAAAIGAAAPVLRARIPAWPLTTAMISAVAWILLAGTAGWEIAWIAPTVVAYIVPFLVAPEAGRKPVLAAAAVAAVSVPVAIAAPGLPGHFGIGPSLVHDEVFGSLIIPSIFLWMVRDLLVWGTLGILVTKDRAVALLWLAWTAILHVLGALAANSGFGAWAALLTWPEPWTGQILNRTWILVHAAFGVAAAAAVLGIAWHCKCRLGRAKPGPTDGREQDLPGRIGA